MYRNDMAYRRRQGISRASTFKEEIYNQQKDDDDDDNNNNNKISSSKSFSASSAASHSLAAQAIRATAAYRESSLSSAYAAGGGVAGPAAGADSAFASDHQRSEGFAAYDHRNENTGFWGVIARKAKAILEEDDLTPQQPARSRWQMADASIVGQQQQQQMHSSEGFRNMDNPRLRKGLDKITSSLNQIGDTFEKAFEEGRTIVETRTADIRKLQMRRKGTTEEQSQAASGDGSWQPPQQNQNYHETQLKASRDVAMATAAKAKLLLRELKTVKADLAFAKERCTQLEEENKLLRESREKGQNPADDDLIRLQLETLLAEKARLALENSIYARENRFLREIVEYHQLTMQDVVYLDEGTEEMTEVYPISTSPLSKILSGSSPESPSSPSEIHLPTSLPVTKEILHIPAPPEEIDHVFPVKEVLPGSNAEVSEVNGAKRPSENETLKEVQPSARPEARDNNGAKERQASPA